MYEIHYELSPDQLLESKTILGDYCHGYKCSYTCEQRDCYHGLTDLKLCARSRERCSALNRKNQITQKKVIKL